MQMPRVPTSLKTGAVACVVVGLFIVTAVSVHREVVLKRPPASDGGLERDRKRVELQIRELRTKLDTYRAEEKALRGTIEALHHKADPLEGPNRVALDAERRKLIMVEQKIDEAENLLSQSMYGN
jgi:hypothetical protein